jgi:hypothetical protein
LNVLVMAGLAMAFEHPQSDRLMAVAGLVLNVPRRYCPPFFEQEHLQLYLIQIIALTPVSLYAGIFDDDDFS